VGEAGLFKLEAQGRGIDRFKQAGTCSAMHLDCQPDDAFRQFLMLQHGNPPRRIRVATGESLRKG
jgi:hypothetical protein